MSFGGIKLFRLIFLDFNRGEYKIFEYEKDRRYTANQAWSTIYHKADNAVLSGKLPDNANIDFFKTLVQQNGYNLKRCDRYMRFGITG